MKTSKMIISYTVFFNICLLVVVSFLPYSRVWNLNSSTTQFEYSVIREREHSDTTDMTLSDYNFKECKNQGIRQLIRDYFDGYLAPKDDALIRCTDTLETFNWEERVFARERVERLMQMKCYYASGLIADSYLVVGSIYVKFRDIDTPIPYIDTFFVRKNVSGQYYICKSEVSNEIDTFNSIMFSGKQVKAMKERVLYELNSACEVDEKLAIFVAENNMFFEYAQ